MKLTVAAAFLIVLGAGCLSPSHQASVQPADSIATTHASDWTAVKLAGKTATGACAVAPTGAVCQYPDYGHDSFIELGKKHNATRLVGNVTWKAASAATMELNAYILVGGEFKAGNPVAWGASPLKVDFNLTAFAGKKIGMGVSTTKCTCPGPVGAATNLPQDFVFEGMVQSD
jgi:hypothetical protein